MALISLKRYHLFKRLLLVSTRRRARVRAPLVTKRVKAYGAALKKVHAICVQDWTMLIMQSRFLQSHQSWTKYITKDEAVAQLITCLEAFEKIIEDQLKRPRQVVYKTEDFENMVFGAIDTLHRAGAEEVEKKAVNRPNKGNFTCKKEAYGWRVNCVKLLDPTQGKLRMKAWEDEETSNLAEILDPEFSVTTIDADGEDADTVPLDDALPQDMRGELNVPEVSFKAEDRDGDSEMT